MSDEVETEIHDLIDARNAAVGRADAAAVVAPLADDAVVYDLQPPLAIEGGAARDTEGLDRWFDTWNAPPKVTMSDLEIRADGDLVVTHGFLHMTGTKKEEGPVDLWSRATLVLERRQEGWRIVHEHNDGTTFISGTPVSMP